MLNPDYKDILQCFGDHRVDFIVVGAYALAAHGFPRSTADIDIWIRPDPANARRAYAALTVFGAPLQDITDRTFAHPGVVYQIGIAPCRIDILTAISGDLDFDDAFDSALRCTLGDVPVRVLGIPALIINKMATGRARDLADVELLRKHQR